MLVISMFGMGAIQAAGASPITVFGQSVPINTIATLTAGTGLSLPFGFASDADGNLYVSNLYGTITVIPTSTGILFGQSVTANVAATLNAAAQSGDSRGIAFDAAGNLYLSQGNTVIPRVSGILFGQSVTANVAVRLNALERVNCYQGITFDAAGNLYEVGCSTDIVEVLPRVSGTLFGQSVTANVAVALNAATGLNLPYGVTFDSSGNLFITNGSRTTNSLTVLPITSGTLFGQSVTANVAVTLNASAGIFQPDNIIFDAAGNLFTTLSNAGKLFVIPRTSGTTYGQSVTANVAVELSAATGLRYPTGIVSDALGNIYIANMSGNNIKVLAGITMVGNDVTFDLNGGSGTTPTEGSHISGATFSLPTSSSNPTKNGYVFAGWSDGTNTYQDANSYTMGSSAVTFTAVWRVSQAQLPTGISLTSLGTPISSGVSLTQTTSVSLTSGSTSASLSVPVGALPAGTTVSVFPVTNTTSLQIPSGQTYVTSIAVFWQALDGSSPDATQPLTLTITDAAIKAGDKMYQLVGGVATLMGTATQAGSAQITFSADPVLVVTRPIPPIIYSKPTSPSNVTASMNNGTATVSFTSGSSGNLPTYNQIDMYLNGQPVGNVCNVTGATSCPISNLGPNASFTFTVTAVNSKGSATSAVSNVVRYASPTTVPPTTTTTTTTMPPAKQTITCAKGKITKKVTAVSPVCPAGYTKK